MLDDTGEGLSPCVYILDVDTLVWTRSTTRAPDEKHNPGARSLHVTTVCLRPTQQISVSPFCNHLLEGCPTMKDMGGHLQWMEVSY